MMRGSKVLVIWPPLEGVRRCWRDGNRAAGAHRRRGRALRAADRAGQIEVGVVEDVVELGPELHLQALDGVENFLFSDEVGLVEGRVRPGLRLALPNGLSSVASCRP